MIYYNNNNYYYNSNDLFGDTRPHDAAIERDLRMQEQQQREAAISRRRRRKLQERKQRFERSRTMAVAASSEEEHFQRRRQHLRDQRRPLSYGNGNQDIDDDDDDYQINVVRGRDGSLYYAKTPVNRQRQERQERRPTIAEESDSEYSSSDSIQSDVEEDDVADIIRRMRPRLVPLARENHPSRASYYSQRTTTASPKRSGRRRGTVTVVAVEDASESECENEFDTPFETAARLRGSGWNPSNRTSHIVTVATVEDASESECENEFDSPRRNRRPSPGQWMEPVESCLE